MDRVTQNGPMDNSGVDRGHASKPQCTRDIRRIFFSVIGLLIMWNSLNFATLK